MQLEQEAPQRPTHGVPVHVVVVCTAIRWQEQAGMYCEQLVRRRPGRVDGNADAGQCGGQQSVLHVCGPVLIFLTIIAHQVCCRKDDDCT